MSTGCALCCSMFSLCGFIFLFLIGILVNVQPEYMKLGKEVKGSGPLFGSAFLYGALFVGSTYYYVEKKKRENGEDVHRFHNLANAVDERKPLLKR